MNRRRSKARAGFPRNLYDNKGYFVWRNPTTGDEFPMGKDRARAFDEALALNLHLAKQKGHASAVDRVFGSSQTVAAWEEKYQSLLAKHALTPATRANYRAFSRHIVKYLGPTKPLRAVTAGDFNNALERIIADISAGVAKAVRNYGKMSFAESIVQGWRDIGSNPVIDTRIVSPPPVARARLSLDVFMRIYNSAPTEWLRNAMALALVSAQRREDVARAEFKDFRDGGWWLTQASEKTDHAHRIFIPNDLQPAGFNLSLGDVVAQARHTGVLSSYVVHQTQRRGPSRVGGKIRLSTVSSVFSAAVDGLGMDWGEKTPPTFHEIRSLAIRLYGEQGVNAQLLAGHSDPGTTAIYTNARGHDYVKVTV
jgi:integrase